MSRACRAFWALVAIAAVAMGVLSDALAARPGPGAGIAVALSAGVLVASVALAARILVRLDRRGSASPAEKMRREHRA
jgi:hypothetical protein